MMVPHASVFQFHSVLYYYYLAIILQVQEQRALVNYFLNQNWHVVKQC